MPPDRIPITALHGIALLAIVSGVFVLLGWFTLPVRVALLVVLAVLLMRSYMKRRMGQSFNQTFVIRHSSFVIPVAAAAAAATLLLWYSGTTEPIRSPWSMVPVPFFSLYALIVVFGIQYSVSSIAIALGLASTVALLIYPLGFGFDHFIHAAAEHIIATTGTLAPPPFFYSAHYGLTVLLADLLPGVGIDLADRLLAPLLTVALLVPLAHRALRTVLPEQAACWGLTSLLIVPFLPLAVSTPQATANVFALATVLLLMERSPSLSILSPPLAEGEREGVYTQTRDWGVRKWITPLATSIAALLAQPMTGIIVVAIVAGAFAWHRGWRIGGAIITALGISGIPLAFAIAGRIIPNLDTRVAFDPFPALQRFTHALGNALTVNATDFAIADALTVARVFLPILWTGLAIAGALTRGVTIFSRPLKLGDTSPSVSHVRPSQRVLMLMFAPLMTLVAAAAVAATVTVPTQLAEEQTQFPLRLVQLAALLATPLVGIGLGTIFDRVRGRLPQLAAAMVIGTAATLTLLLAYPRDDAQARSGLWSVSASDIAAVHAIATDAGDTPYVVLANQMLGAAAIREFGFQPAYRVQTEHVGAGFMPARSGGNESLPYVEILAFPLPAGGPIARKYWEYVSQEIECLSPSFRGGAGGGACPHRQPIDAAMDLVGAQRAYVVLHDYWRNYARLADATALIADGELPPLAHLRIFRFTKVYPEESER